MKASYRKTLIISSVMLIISLGLLFYAFPKNNYVIKHGVVAAKTTAIQSEGRRVLIERPMVGMVFDDGTEEDIYVTLATYDRLNVGDKTSFLVWVSPSVWRVLGLIISALFVAASLVHLSYFVVDRYSD